MTELLPLAFLVLVAFALVLTARGAKLPLRELLRVMESNSREAAQLTALIVCLAFLLQVLRLVLDHF